MPELSLQALARHSSGDRVVSARMFQLYRPLHVKYRPSSDPNVLHYPGGVFVAQVFAASDDAEAVDPSTLRLGGVAPVRHVTNDLNADGRPDLQVYFETTGMRVTPATKRLTLVARTRTGRPAAGSDTVLVISRNDSRTDRVALEVSSGQGQR